MFRRGGTFALPAAATLVTLLLLGSALVALGTTAPSHRPGVAAGTVSPPALAVPPVPAASLLAQPHSVGKSILFPYIPEWMNVTQPGAGAAPLGGFGGSMAYDPVDGVTVYFGGCAVQVCPDNYTWVFANGTWTNVTNPFDSPPTRLYASMDFDPNMGGVLLFGGWSGADYLNDTWLFQGGVWSNLTGIGPAPAAREGALMAFDPEPEENGSVLFGGYVPAFGNYANDTWVWQGWSGWVPLSPSSPPPVSGFSQMAYDPAVGAVVLFGCGFGCVNGVNWTWELYSGQWWVVNPSGTIPPYRTAGSMLYDPGLGAVILFGGSGFSGNLNDTWVFWGSKWTELTFTVAPAGREYASLTWDPTGSVPLLFGGISYPNYFNDTWALETAPSAIAYPAITTAETSSSVNLTVYTGGGAPPYRVVVDFGDGSFGSATSYGAPFTLSHTYAEAGTYSPIVNVTDGVGATGSSVSESITVANGPSFLVSPASAEGDAGQSISFTAQPVSPGVPPLVYSWQFGDGSSGSGATVSHAYPSAGTYAGNVTVTDSLGGTATDSFTVRVNPLPAATVGTSTPSPKATEPLALYANVTGGTGPFTYSWSFGDGTTSHFAAPVHTFPSKGTYTVQVWTNDSAGGSSHATLEVTVGSAPGAGLSGVPLWFWGGLAGLIALGAVGSLLLLRRGRHRTTPP